MEKLAKLCEAFERLAQMSLDQKLSNFIATKFPQVRVDALSSRLNGNNMMVEVRLTTPKDFNPNLVSPALKRIVQSDFGGGVLVNVVANPTMQ